MAFPGEELIVLHAESAEHAPPGEKTELTCEKRGFRCEPDYAVVKNVLVDPH